jgi:hypothetical protein
MADHMLLFSVDGRYAAFFHDDYYEKFLLDKKKNSPTDVKISNFYFVKIKNVMNNKEYSLPKDEEIQISDRLRETMLFYSAFIFHNASESREKFLNLLLQNKPSIHQDFTHACSNKAYRIKYVTSQKESELFDALKHFIDTNKGNLGINSRGVDTHQIQLQGEYIEKILQIFFIRNLKYNLNQKRAAEIFASLCAFLVYSSSSYFFGTETDSPLAFRNLAIAFLNQAIFFDPNLFTEAESNDIKNRLAGTNEAFTCTAVLFRSLQNKLGSTDSFRAIIPATWL